MELLSYVGNCSITTFLLSFTVLFGFIYFLKSRRPKNFPPGPKGLPILGYMPFLGDNAAETLRKMKSKYGPVMSVQMGTEDWIFLNDYESINEALVKQSDKFSGRPFIFMFDLITEGYGILTADYGQTWKELRKFGLLTLRGFGVGKKGMEENVEEEMPYLVESLLNDKGSDVTYKLSCSVSNIICRVVFGSRFSYDDERFSALVGFVRKLTVVEGLEAKLLGAITFAPLLRHVPPFSSAVKTFQADIARFIDIFRDLIKEHEESYDENDIRDFIDAFLKEMKTRGQNDSVFCEKQVLQYIRDLFQAGTTTTSSTLSWAIFCFLHHPEIQEKIHEEILQAIGESGIPSMKHREEMPYTCAFIQEIMRVKTLITMGVFHKTNEEATVAGYTIPKNTTVVPNLWAVHMDPDLFENPTELRPERFLDEDGKFIKSNHVIPFSVGPRHCLGEQLARMELFIFLTGIVQNLKVLPDPNNPPPAFEYSSVPNKFTLEPPPYNVKFERR